MVDTMDELTDRETRRLRRNKTVALLGRETVINRLKSIANMSACVSASPNLVPVFLVSAGDLDNLWEMFLTKNQAVLEALIDLDLSSEFDTNLESEVRVFYTTAKVVADIHTPSTAEGSVGNKTQNDSSNLTGSRPLSATSGSRLPEIPLPSFHGDLTGWPVFRDRFAALVINRGDLSNVERFYYLLGCLSGEALHSISSINVSDDTFELAWTTLSSRFDKPRQLATLIVDKLLSIPDQQTETLDGLKQFLSLFVDQLSMLRTLPIPDLGDFLLFSISARCLPLATRKGFEAANTQDFPTMPDLVNYVENRVSLLEAVSFGLSARRPALTRDKPKASSMRPCDKRSKIALITSDASTPNPDKCFFCPGNHLSTECPIFVDMSTEDRFNLAKEKKICFRCLNSTHWSNKCKTPKSCKKCSGRHHTLLHKDASSLKQPVSQNVEAALVGSSGQPTVLLGTALVHIRDNSGCMQTARAIVDSASQISVISSACADRLGLRRTKWTAPVSGLSGVPVPNVRGIVDCYITPRYNTEHSVQTRAWILPNVTSDMPSRQLPFQCKEKFSHLALADPFFDRPAPIDLLLGADIFSQVLDGKRVFVNERLPAAFRSLFGWIIIGSVGEGGQDQVASNVVSLTVSLEDLLTRFWEVEEPEGAPTTFTDDGKCEDIYVRERVRDSEGRFVVPLPFKLPSDATSFLGSRQVALRRFQNLERKLLTNETLYKAYRDFMLEYEELGHMCIAPAPGSYFIPHHAVFKGDSVSGKLRVVFDASAVAPTQRSLNQCLLIGPKLQRDIVDILLRFRVHKFVFTTDVCKMYRQILVLPKYRAFQHIFWRSSPLEEVKEFELKTVTYGLSCAPFLALRVLQDIADQECSSLPDVREALTAQTYVDDICVGADNIDDLLTLQSNLKLVLARAGFDLKKWSSNSSVILSAVPVEDCVKTVLAFDNNESVATKVLGLQWDPSSDSFGYNVYVSATTFTKRSMLSVIARIFDPLGLLAPVVFLAKYIMQQVWKTNLGWDEVLPTTLFDQWSSLVADLPTLSRLRVPRFLNSLRQAHVQLCGFCDASERGYAAVVYLRVRRSIHCYSVSLLGCKTKMAPMKSTTIPRLELCAAVLLSRWMSRIQGALASQMIIDDVFSWSDSQIVLSWLTNPHTNFKIFVSNRVHRIHQMLPGCKWFFVRSASNPADCASRGVMPSDLLQHPLYWSGPEFLHREECTWNRPTLISSGQLPETRVCALNTEVRSDDEWFSRFSSYTKMLRVVSWMRRFIGRCQRRVSPSQFLCPSELEDALKIIIKCSQQTFLRELYLMLIRGRVPSRTLAALSPFVDDDGLIRVGGRLRHSNLPDVTKNPLLLAKSSFLSSLIARHWHLVTCHSGPRVITSLVNRQFWILSIRVVIRRIIGSCTVCVRTLAQPAAPMMADLPGARVQSSPPFSRVGIDYAGPLMMRECRLRKARQYKAYIALFVCMAVKAVHLEVVLDLSTEAFLAAFDRFTARRGLPNEIYSDCGTNFVGASNHLKTLVNHPDNHERFVNHQPCHWKFSPPSAPHFGGLWEAAVKSTKTLLTRVMGNHNLTLEEFSTVLCRVESVLNSRPLTPMSSSPLDFDYLTPGHFLIGRPLVAVPELPVSESPTLLHKWKLLHQCLQVFWRRWSCEYLCALQAKKKWTNHSPNLKIGDLVIVKDNKSSPTLWRTGRVTHVMPGDDNIVRVARVLTSSGEITRPVIKLVVLPTE